MRFKGLHITLGLTGGIAIYKSASLLRRLVNDEGADVTVIMTAAAQQFMSPLIFETFSGKPVITDMWTGRDIRTRHIDLARTPEAVLVCPATADIIAKAAHGIADDMLSTVILTAGPKTIFAPAMNVSMYANPITRDNIARLVELGYGLIEPEHGDLACKDVGQGRLAEEAAILDYLDMRLNGRNLLKGKKVIVTAGPTREAIDPVRFISNRSSGKMGFALARQAHKEGAQVTLITGPTTLTPGRDIELIAVESAREMETALEQNATDTDYLFMAAAVEDLCPRTPLDRKVKKSALPESIPLSLAPDLITAFRKWNSATCIVGFSVEKEDGKERSLAKLKHKGMDYIVWNDPSRKGVGFGEDTNEVRLYSRSGQERHFPRASKDRIAAQIIEQVVRKAR